MGAGRRLCASRRTANMLPGIHYHRVDFREAVLSLWLRGDAVALEGSHLVVWVQAKVGDRESNWALTGQPLDAAVLAADWTPVVRRFDDESAWTCLDALGMRPDTYTCAPLETVLGDSN